MLCHVVHGLLTYFLPCLASSVAGVSQTLPFSCISSWISYLTLSCLTIDQSNFIYQPMMGAHIHSIQNDHRTALSLWLLGDLKLGEMPVIDVFKSKSMQNLYTEKNLLCSRIHDSLSSYEV